MYKSLIIINNYEEKIDYIIYIYIYILHYFINHEIYLIRYIKYNQKLLYYIKLNLDIDSNNVQIVIIILLLFSQNR